MIEHFNFRNHLCIVFERLSINLYDFLKENDILTEDFINKLTTPEQKDVCNQLNRRTEFRVLKDDYGINTVPFGED